MCSGRICRYDSLDAGIDAIDRLLGGYEARGRDTIEEMNGYYVQPASANWYNTVSNVKRTVESLEK